jgi:hypothetical protein
VLKFVKVKFFKHIIGSKNLDSKLSFEFFSSSLRILTWPCRFHQTTSRQALRVRAQALAERPPPHFVMLGERTNRTAPKSFEPQSRQAGSYVICMQLACNRRWRSVAALHHLLRNKDIRPWRPVVPGSATLLYLAFHSDGNGLLR